MGKKVKQADSGPDPNAWMVTFGDLVTLLLTFFVLLLSMASMDDQKMKEISSATSGKFMNLMEEENFTGRKIFEVLHVDFLKRTRQAIEQAMSKMPKKIRMVMISDEKLVLYRKKEKTKGMFPEQEGSLGVFRPDSTEKSEGSAYETLAVVSKETSGIRITLMEELTFDPGQTRVKEYAKIILRAILDATFEADLALTILNFTDNSPVHSPQFKNNWEFSTARSAGMARFIQSEKLMPDENVRISGLGDSRPVKSNETEEGRRENLRTELWLEPYYNWDNSETPLVSMKIFESSADAENESNLVPDQPQKLDGMPDIDPLQMFPNL